MATIQEGVSASKGSQKNAHSFLLTAVIAPCMYILAIYNYPTQVLRSGLMAPGLQLYMVSKFRSGHSVSPGKPKPDDSDDDLMEELLAGISGGASWNL